MRVWMVAALMVVTGLVTAPQAQSGVDGKWTLLFDTPMGTLDAAATFKTEGNNLTGTLESQAGTTSFKGTVKGNAIAFVMNVSTPQGEMAIQMNAEVEGDAIKGTFDFGQGVGNWTGKRVK
jgi:aerobic carbon-monoxide dehydrogenase large subunit